MCESALLAEQPQDKTQEVGSKFQKREVDPGVTAAHATQDEERTQTSFLVIRTKLDSVRSEKRP